MNTVYISAVGLQWCPVTWDGKRTSVHRSVLRRLPWKPSVTMATESKYMVSHHKKHRRKWFTNCFSAHSEFSLINIRRVITILIITIQQMVFMWLTDAEQLAEARLFSLISWKISSHLEVDSGPLQVNTQHSLGYTGDEPRESCSRF